MNSYLVNEVYDAIKKAQPALEAIATACSPFSTNWERVGIPDDIQKEIEEYLFTINTAKDMANGLLLLAENPGMKFFRKGSNPQKIQVGEHVFPSREHAEKAIFDWIAHSDGSEQARYTEALLKVRNGETKIKL